MHSHLDVMKSDRFPPLCLPPAGHRGTSRGLGTAMVHPMIKSGRLTSFMYSSIHPFIHSATI
jgi:hypothetical protein